MFDQNHRNPMNFTEIPKILLNSVNFMFFCKWEALAPPLLKSLIILREYLCFGEDVQQKYGNLVTHVYGKIYKFCNNKTYKLKF